MVRIINWKQIVCLHSVSAILVNFIENNSETVEEGQEMHMVSVKSSLPNTTALNFDHTVSKHPA